MKSNSTPIPMINRLSLDLLYGGAEAPVFYNDIPRTPYVPLNDIPPASTPGGGGSSGESPYMSLSDLRNLKSTERRFEPSINRTEAELTDTSGRYEYYTPNYNNEDAYAQNQAFTTKAFNGITKGLALTGTTFLQTTAGLVNGVYRASTDGRFASFYDNDFNRNLDEFNKRLENKYASYETDVFKNANWYSPDYLLTGNFIFEGVIKNLGFAAGAALSGMAFSPLVAISGNLFGKLPVVGKLLSAGKAAEVAAATEAGLTGIEGLGKLKSLSDKFLSAYKTLNPAQRYVVAGLSTSGEAGIEAYHNLNEFRDNAIAEFTKEFNRAPEGSELIQINKLSDDVGNSSMMMNMVLLSATNYIQFPKILGSSYKAERGILNEISSPIKNISKASGKYAAKVPATRGGRIFQKVRRVLSNPYAFSYSEAFEEGSQFAITKSTEDYYNKKHNNKNHDWVSSIIEGYKETITSNEGMKNILIGGLSGALMLSRGKYLANRDLTDNTGKAVKAFNGAPLSNFTKDTYDSVVRGSSIQQERELYNQDGNVLDSKDAEYDYIINYLAPRIKYGRYDLVKSEIEEYRVMASTEEGWEQLQKEGKAQPTDTPESFLNRLSSFEDTAENVKSLYQSINLRYGNLKDRDGNKVYTNEIVDKMVYASSKIADYDNRYNQLASEVLHPAVDLDAMSEQSIAGEDILVKKAAEDIRSDKKLNETQQDDIIDKVYDAVSIAVRRNNFLSAYNEIKNNPSQFVTDDIAEIAKEDEGKSITVKTKKGDKNVEIGKEYFMMPPVNYTEAATVGVREPYKVVILGENKDGTVKIQGKNGTVKNVSPEDLAEYNMGSVENTSKNKKAKFVLDNLNDEFIHYGIDEFGNRRKGENKGEPAKGYLYYSYKDNKLDFVFQLPNGKVIHREVSNTLFKAKKGFDGAMIRRTDKNISKQQQKSEKSFIKGDLSLSEKFQRRTEIIKKLVDDNKAALGRINKKLEVNKKRLDSIDKEISDVSNTKSGKPRKRITKVLQRLIKELYSLKETLPAEISRLEEQKINTEAQQEILEGFLDDLGSLDDDSATMLENIRQDINSIDEMINLTVDSIDKSNKQLGLVDELYQKALSLLNDYILRLKEENPKTPLSIDALRDNLEKYLGEVGANTFIENKQGFTNQVLELDNSILEFQEELTFPQLDSKRKSLSKNIKELENGLDTLTKDQIALVKILDAFEDFVKEEELKQATEEILKNNPTILKTLKATQDNDGESSPFDEDYEPEAKKATHIIATASIGKQDGKDHQERANIFGFNLSKMKKAGKNVRGVYVTEKTEESLGLKGLMNKLATDEQGNLKEGVDTSTIIVTVMVTEGELIPVDVNGEPITTADILNQAIYQVHPLGDLKWSAQYSDESMFRDGTPEDIKQAIIKKFKEWREEIISRKEIDSTFDPKASFGFLSFDRDAENAINYDQRTAVTEAGLIGSKADVLKTQSVIVIPTVEEAIARGTTQFKSPYKRVLLKADDGYVQLQNKKHTEKQATTIFKAILEVAKELVESESKGTKLDSLQVTRVLDYLRGMVYWGTPETREGKRKSVGFNSIFFEKDKDGNNILYIGRDRDSAVIFTPLELERNSSKIIESIQSLYSNSSNKKIQDLNEAFEEITDIEADGTIISTIWPNYQTYLLSNKLPVDGKISKKSKKRTSKNIPLTTYANPITEEAPVNRTGIYFYNLELIEYYRVETKKKASFKEALPENREITEGDVTELINSGAKGVEAAMKKAHPKPAKRIKVYKKLYVEKLIKRIAEIAIGKDDKVKYDKFIDTTKKKLSKRDLDEQVQLIGNAYTNALTSDKQVKEVSTKRKSPFQKKRVLSLFDKQGSKPTRVEEEDTEAVEEVTEEVEETATQKGLKDLFNKQDDTEAIEETGKPANSESNRKGPFNKVKRKKRFRIALENKYKKPIVENWEEVQLFLKKAFPNVPVYRVKNIMRSAEGEMLWGMFQDGAIYVYDSAEVGTTYHEVFEAVWKMFTDVKEQAGILEEFKERTGEFIDRPSGKKVNYADATAQQIKEQLAEEFRKYVLKKGLPQKSIKNRILNMFKDLVKFIRNLKNLFKSENKNKIDDLFKRINTGYYKDNNDYASQLSFAQSGLQDIETVDVKETAEFSKIPKLTDHERNDVIEQLIYSTLTRFVAKDEALFSLKPQSITDEMLLEDIEEVFRDVRRGVDEYFEDEVNNTEDVLEIEEIEKQRKYEVAELINKFESIKSNFPIIKNLFVEKIKSFSITLDSNDEAQINNEDKTRNSDYVDATKVDSFRKMNSAFKLLFSTVAKVDQDGYDVVSSIGGVKTLTYGEVVNTLMKTLHTSKNIPEMLSRFRELAELDPNYRRLYTRFTKTSYMDDGAGFSNIDSVQSFRMLAGLWKIFSLQAPQVKNVFLLNNGTVEVGDASLSSAASQLKNSFINTIILNSKSGKGFFRYSSESGGVYNVDKKEVKKYRLTPTFDGSYTAFLKKLGIEFSVAEIKLLDPHDFESFKTVVSGIKMSLNRVSAIKSFSAKDLDLSSRLFKLALYKTKVSNPAYQTTYFNVSGERTQTFIGGNSPRRLYRALSQIKNIKELEGTEFDYLMDGMDSFVEGSVILDRLVDEDGDVRQSEVESKLLEVGYVGGIIDEAKGKNVQSSKLKLKSRLVQELNLNLKGWYLNLVPGDSSTEWMTYTDNHVSVSELSRSMDSVHTIFKNYFISEYNLSRENRDVYKNPRDSKKSRNPKDLRFFKDMLSPATLIKVNKSTAKSGETVYKNNEKEIRAAVERAIESNNSKLEGWLTKFDILKENEDKTFYLENINIKEASKEKIDMQLKMLTINYMINNIEMHKLLYGDPFQYKDELKRTKSFQSPRQELLNSSKEMNSLTDKIWNKFYNNDDIGHSNFIRDYFRTITYSDVNVVSEFKDYGIMEETDGGGIISLKALRNFKIRSSDWTESNEKQYTYEVAWEKNDKGIKLSSREVKSLKLGNPKVKDTFTAIKPIVTGNRKSKKTHNATVLDKYSLYPISYRMMKEMNAPNGIKLHNKMLTEDVDYVIFNSGRKVGAYTSVAPYNEDGSFNSEVFVEDDFINIPFSIIGLQVEVPSKEGNTIPRATQVTKLITMDKMDAGVPLDYEPTLTEAQRFRRWWALKDEKARVDVSPLFKEIINNKNLLEAQIDWGYEVLLKKLGFTKTRNGGIRMDDYTKTVELLKGEVLLRESSDNIIEALQSFMVDSSVLEATPAYRQISNILYSIVDKNILRSKITGGMKVQIPGTFWEENRLGISEINGKKGYTSDALGFYTEGVVDPDTGEKKQTNVMEIYAGRWFKSNMNDTDLLEYLNNTKEGQKILSGFAFRIPTQNINSIDAFRIKKFLPEEFGDNVVVPSAIVGKVGSDFDIDKLTMYLKSVFIDENNKPIYSPYFGIGSKALLEAKKYAGEYLKRRLAKAEKNEIKQKQLQDNLGALYLGNMKGVTNAWKWVDIFREWFEEDLIAVGELDNLSLKLPISTLENIFINRMEKLGKTIDELTDADFFEELKERTGEKLYKQGLQNAYIESNETLLLHPSNFGKLTAPNSAQPFKDLAEKIHTKLGNPIVEYSNPINFLDRTFMTQMRHDFVAGKQGIGIAAVGQTNNANNQAQIVTIDIEKIKDAPANEREYLQKGGGLIKFKNYNTVHHKGKVRPTLSKRLNQAGEYISDLLGMFVDGYVDISDGAWIMQLGAIPETTGTWQFLLKLGVPKEDVAYFMNQPIIKDYIQMIENKGYNWLFIDTFRDELQQVKYASDTEVHMKTIPPASVLWKTIGKTKLTDTQNALQQEYLDEFLKYAMMARHGYYFTQGTNFDTANFNNPYLLFKKEQQYLRAKNSIIGGVDEVIDNSFLKAIKDNLIKAREALSQILISDKPNMREVVEATLLPYINLSDREFVKMAQKTITNLFDWAVQTHEGLNEEIEDVLIFKNNSAQTLSTFITEVKKDVTHDLYGNYVIELAEILPARTAEFGSTDNVRIKLQSSEVYDKNRLINAFKELKEYANNTNSSIYNELVLLAVLQSGLSSSNMSFTEHLPFKDFSSIYNQSISLIEKRADLSVFKDLNVFQRNNWNDSNIVDFVKAPYIKTIKTYNPGMSFLLKNQKIKEAVTSGKIPHLVTIQVRDGKEKDHLVYSWEDDIINLTNAEKTQANKDGKRWYQFLKDKKEAMREAGDFSFMHKGLFQKVFKMDGTPRIHSVTNTKGETRDYYIFKAINPWGNGSRANEFYDVARQSVINNGFEKVTEVSDTTVITYFDSMKPYKPKVKPTLKNKDVLSGTSFRYKGTVNIFSGTNENAHLSNFAKRPFTFNSKNYLSVEHAYQTLKSGKYNSSVHKRGTDFVGKKINAPRNVDKSISLSLMKTLMLTSFKQNAVAKNKLLNTVGSKLTHVGGRDSFWEANFPELLMEVRSMLNNRSVNPKNPNNTMTLKNKKTYKFSEINSKLLLSLGYTDAEQRGRILKIIC